MVETNGKIKLIYFYDALCGWCYGFSPVIAKIYANYQDRFEFEIISGGLKIGDAVGPIGVVAPYIKAGAYRTVEERSGVRFGEAFVNGPLEEGTMILNSLPPGIALSIVKKNMPDRAFEFASILHKAIYIDGLHPEDLSGYGRYAEKIGLNSAEFVTNMQLSEFEKRTKQEFALSQQLGIRGFPTLIGVKADSAFMITHGYEEYDLVAAKLDSL
ncbi:MAG: DsbA family protein [Bacteroidota bacterium]